MKRRSFLQSLLACVAAIFGADNIAQAAVPRRIRAILRRHRRRRRRHKRKKNKKAKGKAKGKAKK